MSESRNAMQGEELPVEGAWLDAMPADDFTEDAEIEEDAAEGVDATHLWPGDAGTLPLEARTALLRLVKGPYLGETQDSVLWRALLNYADPIRSRLADLFLDLVIDAEAGVAFARNVSAEGREFPKAATSYSMTLLDTIMVLLLRKELQTAGASRVFIGQTDLFEQMQQHRAIDKQDQSAFLRRLEASWGRLVKQRLVVKTDVEGRFEVSPVLKLVFGAEEAAAVFEEYQHLRDQAAGGSAPVGGEDAADGGVQAGVTQLADQGERTLFDGLE